MRGHSDKLKVEEAISSYGSPIQDGTGEVLQPMAHIDARLNHIHVNDAYAAAFGYAPQEMAGVNLRNTVSPDDHAALKQYVNEVTQTGRTQGMVKGIRKDGSSFYQRFLINRDDRDGLVYHYFMVDITEEKQRDRLQRLEQNILRQIAFNLELEKVLEDLCLGIENILGNAICVITLLAEDGRTMETEVAPSMPEALLGSGEVPDACREAINSDQLVIVEDVLDSPLWEGYQDLTAEYGIKASWSNPLKSRNGSVIGAFGIAIGRNGVPTNFDMELLRVAGHLSSIAIDSSRSYNLLRRYEEMVSSSRDMMVYIDRDYVYRAVSISAAEYVGLSRDQVIGHKVVDIIGQELFEKEIKDRLDETFEGKSIVRSSWLQLGDKTPLYVTSHFDPIMEDGEVIGVVVVIRDTSETRLIEEALRESEQRFNLAMRGVNDGLWDWIPETDTMYYSATWGKMLGYTDEEYTGSWRDFHVLVHEDDRQNVINTLLDFAESQDDRFEMEYRLLHKDGRYLDILSRGFGVRDQKSSRIKRIIGINADITGRKTAELKLLESERRFRALYDDLPTMFFTLDTKGVIRSVNRFGADHLGFSVEDLIGKNIAELAHKDEKKRLRNRISKCVANPERLQRCEFRASHKFGNLIWVRASLRQITRDDSTDILLSCEDITETRMLSEQLEYQAKHDSLTDLINRAEFERRLRRILNSKSVVIPHAVCYLDLDQFKIVNDTCGHLAGDELLRRVSQLLKTVVRKRDTLARLGGDEFAVLLEHCPLEQARRVAMDVLDAVHSMRFSWDGKRFNLGVTIGLVPIGENSGTVTDVLSAADAACYAAKDAGRNRIHVYHPDDTELSKRRGEMQWVSEINRALEENRLCLAMQPIVPLSGYISGKKSNHFELLLRMVDESGKVIFPGAFLPAAERYNLTTRLDRWVVSAAFDWLTKNPDELESLSLCAINLSGHSFGEPEFLDFMLEKFQSENIDAQKFCFEITETAVIANLVDAIHFITTLKEIGCSFALDDFGTGLSSFNYLKNLPVDYLKIDGSFIHGITHDPIDRAMVRSINEIGHVMGKETIAEFVENDEILWVLREIGVDYAQGFATGRPEMLPSPDLNPRPAQNGISSSTKSPSC